MLTLPSGRLELPHLAIADFESAASTIPPQGPGQLYSVRIFNTRVSGQVQPSIKFDVIYSIIEGVQETGSYIGVH